MIICRRRAARLFRRFCRFCYHALLPLTLSPDSYYGGAWLPYQRPFSFRSADAIFHFREMTIMPLRFLRTFAEIRRVKRKHLPCAPLMGIRDISPIELARIPNKCLKWKSASFHTRICYRAFVFAPLFLITFERRYAMRLRHKRLQARTISRALF